MAVNVAGSGDTGDIVVMAVLPEKGPQVELPRGDAPEQQEADAAAAVAVPSGHQRGQTFPR